MKQAIIVLTSLILLLGMSGCVKKQAEKNMEQIQKEEGIPVRVTEIQPSTFVQTNTYNATLSGIEESVVKSMVSDVVAKINVKVGDYVKKDQVILSFPQETPSALYIQASLAFQNAKTTYERMQRLFSQGAISQQDLDNVTTAYNVAQANLNTSKSMIYVKAPISGYITTISVNPGDKVDSGADLLTVSNTSKYKAVIWIPDSEIQGMKKGLKATAQWNEEILSGYISSLAMAMDQSKKAFRAEIVFNTKTRYIASGVTVEVKINTLTIPNSIVVDRSSMLESGDKFYAWKVVNGKAVKNELQVGHNNGIEYEVKSGLTAGDQLITEGLTMVYEGCLVKVTQ
jgi:membrane fusion protein, multidrug efflux system